MKLLKTILLLLVVVFTQTSFSQTLQQKWDEGEKFKSNIALILSEANNEQEAEHYINRIMSGDGDYITVQDKQNIANGYFEKCKKKLAKWDEKLAAGKKVSSDDAMYAANYYILGYKKICNQNYSKALEYLKLCPQIPITKMYTVALQYELNKDKAAAKAAMNFIDKPSEQLSEVASQFGLGDMYQQKVMSLIADKKQAIKRAIRSQDYETLLSYIPYDIPEVDSLFAIKDVPIAIATYVNGNNYRDRSIEEVENFDDRNVIRIYQDGLNQMGWNLKDCRDYFMKKCIYKHQMTWTLFVDFNMKEIAESYPTRLQILSFYIKDDDGDYKIQKAINEYCSDCDKNFDTNRTLNETKLLNYIRSFQPRNMLASFVVAVMTQVYGQIGRKTTGYYDKIVYSTEFKLELYNLTKEIVDQYPALQNNQHVPVTISSNGKVIIREGLDNPNEITKNIYKPLVDFLAFVYNNKIKEETT